MKKTIIATTLICISFVGFSQLRLTSTGRVGIGTTTPNELLQLGDRWTYHNGYTKAIVYNGKYSNGTWYRLASDQSSSIQFDAYGHIYFRVAAYGGINSSFSWSTAFRVQNDAKTRFYGNVGINATPSSTYKLYVYGTALSDDWLEYSDRRRKENINELSDKITGLNKLHGVSYTLKEFPSDDTENGSVNDRSNESSNQARRIQYGFIAQELKEIYPDLVVEDENGMLAISYNSIIPLLVEAYKSQQKQIATVQQEVAELNAMTNAEDRFIKDGFRVYPNPLSDETHYTMAVPSNTQKAMVYITNAEGKLMKKIKIRERGNSEITINTTEFSSGIYSLSLITDGEIIDTEQIVINK
ncbi:MAG: tail fiber domain-containing protein [Methanosarcinaceae archaeon]